MLNVQQNWEFLYQRHSLVSGLLLPSSQQMSKSAIFSYASSSTVYTLLLSAGESVVHSFGLQPSSIAWSLPACFHKIYCGIGITSKLRELKTDIGHETNQPAYWEGALRLLQVLV